MTTTGFILILLGALIFYRAYKKKIIKTKEGQSLKDFNEEMLNQDANTALKRGAGVGCSAYLKIMGFIWGGALIVIGIIFLMLS